MTPAPNDDLAPQVLSWVAGGERYDVEFKSEQRSSLNDRELLEAVVCLANGSGGVLRIGVEDDGAITGARPRHESGMTDPLRVQALVANGTQPPLSTVVATAEVEGHPVLVVEVPNSPRVVGTTKGTYLRRSESPVSRRSRGRDRGCRSAQSPGMVVRPLEFERLRRLLLTGPLFASRPNSNSSPASRACDASCPPMTQHFKSCGVSKSRSTISLRFPCSDSPKRCSTGFGPEIVKRSFNSGCCALRWLPTRRQLFAKRLPTPLSTATTRGMGRFMCSGPRSSSRSPVLEAFRLE